MKTLSYQRRRSQLEDYFDRTAAETWARLTSDRPVSRIRATVRAGRDRMRRTLLDGLPEDLHGRRVLDAGCGTGALAIEAAERGAEVLAIDVAGSLVQLARERVPENLRERIDFRVGDMLDPKLGVFDHVVAMDSLIHYAAPDMIEMIARLSERSTSSLSVTFAPRTLLLTLMHWFGRFFPRSDRAPAIVPMRLQTLERGVRERPCLAGWRLERSHRIERGFYISQTLELRKAPLLS